MYQVKIERHEYTATSPYNPYKATSYKAHVEDENGVWVEEAPARDTWEQANDDANLFREQIRERTRQ